MGSPERLRVALAAIDEANAADPNIVTARGRTGPKEIVHAELVTEWVRRLKPDAGEPLLLAARGHHFRRWTVPRASYPEGRAGYLRWRKALHEQHARELAAVVSDAGYDESEVARVQALVRKEGLAAASATDDVQVLEDALCLVFLETQLVDLAARLDPETLPGVITKTARKMSGAGLSAIWELPLGPGVQRLLSRRPRGPRLECSRGVARGGRRATRPVQRRLPRPGRVRRLPRADDPRAERLRARRRAHDRRR
jgi:hypothetical protein